MDSLNWYVLYTRPKAEKMVDSELSQLGFESFLPLQKVTRQWSDRKKQIMIPLFPNYVFVRSKESHRLQIFNIKGVVRFLSIDKRPIILGEKDVSLLYQIAKEDVEIHNEHYFQEGMKVRIKYGHFEGVCGVVAKECSNSRIIVKVDGIMKAYSFNMAIENIEQLKDADSLTVEGARRDYAF